MKSVFEESAFHPLPWEERKYIAASLIQNCLFPFHIVISIQPKWVGIPIRNFLPMVLEPMRRNIKIYLS